MQGDKIFEYIYSKEKEYFLTLPFSNIVHTILREKVKEDMHKEMLCRLHGLVCISKKRYGVFNKNLDSTSKNFLKGFEWLYK